MEGLKINSFVTFEIHIHFHMTAFFSPYLRKNHVRFVVVVIVFFFFHMTLGVVRELGTEYIGISTQNTKEYVTMLMNSQLE